MAGNSLHKLYTSIKICCLAVSLPSHGRKTCSIGLLLVSAALAAIGLQRTGWLDRVVQYQKEKLFNEIRELAPININAEIRPKPEGYKDSEHWDYDSVLRLLTLIRGSETAKPVYKALRRMLQPTRRLMMSMKESMHRFPSIKKDDNAFYYDVDYTSSEEGTLPAPPPVPEDQVVLVVSNPVEARLPSSKISVKLLRQILEARAQAARQMPSTTRNIPWVEFVKNRNSTTTASTDAVGTTTRRRPVTTTTHRPPVATDDADATTRATDPEGGDEGGDTTVANAGGDGGTTVPDGGDEGGNTTTAVAGGDGGTTVPDGDDEGSDTTTTVAGGDAGTTVPDGGDKGGDTTTAVAGGDGGTTVPDGGDKGGDTTAGGGTTGDGGITDPGRETKTEGAR